MTATNNLAAQASDEPMRPYAYEYGKSNGDGTYSVVIERGDYVKVGENKYENGPPARAVKDWPVKPLYLATPNATADVEQLRTALIDLIEVAERCDSWQSFPSDALDAARLAATKGAKP
jgi:hypothetical protein